MFDTLDDECYYIDYDDDGGFYSYYVYSICIYFRNKRATSLLTNAVLSYGCSFYEWSDQIYLYSARSREYIKYLLFRQGSKLGICVKEAYKDY